MNILVDTVKENNVVTLKEEDFTQFDAQGLLDEKFLTQIARVENALEQQRILLLAGLRASELGIKRKWNNYWRTFYSEYKKQQRTKKFTKFPEQALVLRSGEWETSAEGVFRYLKAGWDMKKEIASPIPIMPTEILRDVEDGTEQVRLSFYKNGRWQELIVARSILASNTKILDLADLGLEVNCVTARPLVQYIGEIIALNLDVLPIKYSTDHLGWCGNVFIPYSKLATPHCSLEFKGLVASVTWKGELQKWVDYLRPLRRNIYLRLAMAASFASPLIEVVGALPFILHLWGGSGSGKTVASMVAGSIWGNPALGKLVRTMNMTINSLMTTASVLRSIPFIGDELQTIKSKFDNYDNLVMQVCEGVDRGRMVNSVVQKQRVWYNSFIFTGEEPCTQNCSGGGVKNRVLEIECTEKVVDNGNDIVNFITKNYGHAGRVFIENLNKEQVLRAYKDMLEIILRCSAATEKQAMAMALLFVADDLASRLFWQGEEVLSLKQVGKFLKTEQDVSIAKRAHRLVIDLIAENRPKFTNEYAQAGGVCWGDLRDDNIVVMNKSVLEREMQLQGLNFDACKREWANKGFLQLTKTGRFSMARTIKGVKAHFVTLKLVEYE